MWTVDLVDSIALESDSEAIEYLSRHDFNLEEAVFSVYCEMGCGKGTKTISNSFDNFCSSRIPVPGRLRFHLFLS
jgi:hypothetical protein